MAENNETLQKWIDGKMSLGTAAAWEKDEIRLISEIAYTLSNQGRNQEAIVLFEGLLAIAPATAYFQSALGALYLREGDFFKAFNYLNSSLKIEPDDIVSLINRGEASLRKGNNAAARQDLEKALETSPEQPNNAEMKMTLSRARALLKAC